MRQLVTRLLVAAWFVGMVFVAVQGMPVQGQSPVNPSQYFPMVSGALSPPDPLWRDYYALFMGSSTGVNTIYRMRGDGSDLTPLTHDSLPKKTPRWSPDRSYVAYIEGERYGPDRLVVMRGDGSDPQRIAVSDGTIRYEWSPLEELLLVQLQSGETHQLYLFDAAGSAPIFVTDLPAEFAEEYTLWEWSPNGRWFYYFDRTTTLPINEVWARSMTTGTMTRVVDDAIPGMVQWAPDSRLLYVGVSHNNGSWLSVTPDGQNTDGLFSYPYSLIGVVDDNRRLLVRDAETNNLATMLIGSETIEPLTTHSGIVGTVKIAPEGAGILYRLYQDSSPQTSAIYWHPLTSESDPVPLQVGCDGNCDLYSASWAENQSVVLFSLITRHQDTITEVFVAPLRPTPGIARRLVNYRENMWSVSYLPFASHKAFIQQSNVEIPPYPPPYEDKPFLLDTAPDQVMPFPFANDGLIEFGEWWYLP